MRWFWSKKKKSLQGSRSKLQPPEVDTLYRICRRLQSRVTDVEALAGNNRRDIARVEKRIQREAEAEPVPQVTGGEKPGYLNPIDSPFGRV